MAIQWFRSWSGAPTDIKWLALSKRTGIPAGIVSAIIWALLDHASQHKDRGSIEGFDIEGYAAFSGFEEDLIITIMKAIEEKGLVTNGRFKSWEKRQPEKEDSTAAARKRKQRDREKVTLSHALSQDVTLEQTRPDQDQTQDHRP